MRMTAAEALGQCAWGTGPPGSCPSVTVQEQGRMGTHWTLHTADVPTAQDELGSVQKSFVGSCLRRGGETGRRRGLKIPWGKPRVGSRPTPGTEVSQRFFTATHRELGSWVGRLRPTKSRPVGLHALSK